MRSIINSISIYLVAGAISLPGVLFTQAQNSDDDRKCLSVDGALFEARVIPIGQDFNPHHDHGGVILRGRDEAILLYLRTDGAYERAKSIASEMNRAFAIGHKPNIELYSPPEHPRESTRGGEWHHPKKTSASHWSQWSIWLVEYDKKGNVKHPHELVTISSGDVAGFRNRAPGGDHHDTYATSELSLKSAHDIDFELVANWWAANLSDLLTMFVCSEEPTRTHGTFAGEIYERIYHEAREHYSGDPIPLDVWRDVLADLDPTDKIALRRAGQFLPEDFR